MKPELLPVGWALVPTVTAETVGTSAHPTFHPRLVAVIPAKAGTQAGAKRRRKAEALDARLRGHDGAGSMCRESRNWKN